MEDLLVSLQCFKFNPDIRASDRKRLFNKIRSLSKELGKKGTFICRQYLSTKHNSDFIIWNMSDSYSGLLTFKTNLMDMGRGYLDETYSYLSVYEHPNVSYLEQDPRLKYLVAYPVKKDPKWYLLGKEEQTRIMKEHISIAVNSKYNKNIRSYTTSSFSIDDFEFLLLYEVDSITEWMKVARELRRAKARKWIIVENPVFVGESAAAF